VGRVCCYHSEDPWKECWHQLWASSKCRYNRIFQHSVHGMCPHMICELIRRVSLCLWQLRSFSLKFRLWILFCFSHWVILTPDNKLSDNLSTFTIKLWLYRQCNIFEAIKSLKFYNYRSTGYYPSSCPLFKIRRFGDWVICPSLGGTYRICLRELAFVSGLAPSWKEGNKIQSPKRLCYK
jgi:hypothetical protein